MGIGDVFGDGAGVFVAGVGVLCVGAGFETGVLLPELPDEEGVVDEPLPLLPEPLLTAFSRNRPKLPPRGCSCSVVAGGDCLAGCVVCVGCVGRVTG